MCTRTRCTHIQEYVVKKAGRKSTHFKLVAVAEDEATSEFIAVIKFRDIDGQFRLIEQPRSCLRKIEQLRDALANAGAKLYTVEKENRKAIWTLCRSADHAIRWKYAASVGWYDGHRAFVLRDRVIGRARGTALILPPRAR